MPPLPLLPSFLCRVPSSRPHSHFVHIHMFFKSTSLAFFVILAELVLTYLATSSPEKKFKKHNRHFAPFLIRIHHACKIFSFSRPIPFVICYYLFPPQLRFLPSPLISVHQIALSTQNPIVSSMSLSTSHYIQLL